MSTRQLTDDDMVLVATALQVLEKTYDNRSDTSWAANRARRCRELAAAFCKARTVIIEPLRGGPVPVAHREVIALPFTPEDMQYYTIPTDDTCTSCGLEHVRVHEYDHEYEIPGEPVHAKCFACGAVL